MPTLEFNFNQLVFNYCASYLQPIKECLECEELKEVISLDKILSYSIEDLEKNGFQEFFENNKEHLILDQQQQELFKQHSGIVRIVIKKDEVVSEDFVVGLSSSSL